ncbi:hypothetical protein KKG63_01080 [Patescibacteria group bacterium]|nr:hypothetical protein [Patescibacteria group bacterium]
MDVQLAFVILVALLTGSVIVVSVYVVFVLKEFRTTIQKANTILDDAQEVTESVKQPVNSIMSLVNGAIKGIKTAKSVKSIVNLWDKMEG